MGIAREEEEEEERDVLGLPKRLSSKESVLVFFLSKKKRNPVKLKQFIFKL